MSENGTACSENVADKGRQPPALWAWRLERLSLGPLLGVETGKAEVLLLLLNNSLLKQIFLNPQLNLNQSLPSDTTKGIVITKPYCKIKSIKDEQQPN